jgi:hypothetical protein
MNAIEIEEAVTVLSETPFDRNEFPYAFLVAFGNKDTTIKRLRSGTSNKSDLGGVLQANNLHIAIAESGKVNGLLNSLKNSPASNKGKVRFVVATDGADFEAEDLETGETVACAFKDFPDHFGFFLPLAGISTVKQIRESSFDIRATSRLNKLYIELLKDNPEWGTTDRRHEMNHLMARLIFCFFAENTDIFSGERLFTDTVEKMSERDSSNTHQVISEIFRAMDTNLDDRPNAKLTRWADAFPYVNGGLFSGSVDVPRFSKISRSYLLHIGSLEWTKINPDIFGSMIQAVADDEERGELGMHYTSVPNILKVLNPLFLDELRERLEEAGDNPRTLLNLRKRISKIRVFDPACGSGNFLVIAYKHLREIENAINVRRGESGKASEIPLTNFRGIELRDFSAEIARLALVITEYQCDQLYRGQKEALDDFLPLDSQNWITCGNALRLDWLGICPPTGSEVKVMSDDLFETPLDQAEIDFQNEGGETYICGNPPYKGSKWQTEEQKNDLKLVFDRQIKNWKSLDYVAGWFWKAAQYNTATKCASALVSTNSICQGHQVPVLWPEIFKLSNQITFAHTSFKWANLASHNAGVTVVIVGISANKVSQKRLYSATDDGIDLVKEVPNINAYLISGENTIIDSATYPLNPLLGVMQFGNHPYYGSPLIFSLKEANEIITQDPRAKKYIRPFYGSKEFIQGAARACMWVEDDESSDALSIEPLKIRASLTAKEREGAKKDSTAQKLVETPYRFRDMSTAKENLLIIPGVSSENREYLPCGLLPSDCIVSNTAFAIYDAELWNMALLASRLHLIWVSSVCVRLEMRYRYSNTLGWNTFPIPQLTDKNKLDLTRCAEDILLARESHFPQTIADLYDPETMPTNLLQAHECNDEVLERIYIGRRFRNDTERLEKLFELYTKMTSKSISNKNKVGTTV